MPRRALRCIVDLQIHALSAPGVWLPSKEDVYLSVSLFNQYRNTRLLTSIFPLLVHEKFQFEKTYYTAVDPSHVAEMLEDELVIFELVQLSEYTDGAVRLASFSTNARDFLYPYPTLAPSYSAHEREILMCRTIAFPGIAPKLEFSTKTIIKESYSPELDALDDAMEMERESRSSRKTRRQPQSRARSQSPSVRRKLADISLENTIDPRPPFVVRKLTQDLIGRVPSSTTDKTAKSKPKRSASPFRPASQPSSPTGDDDLNNSLSSKPSYRLSKVIRKPFEDPLPVFKPRYGAKAEDDIDPEVEELTSTKPSYASLRPRSVSPLLYKSSFRDRYGDSAYSRPFTPSYYERLAARELELARARRYSRLYRTYYDSLDDLDLELRLARIRAGLYY
ncbi:spermatogenesis associated 6-like protein [Physella acuta]|uniref:spermatogenesis associated 6-like protein n=1 Tax=Physella acuta TaxID=109671 RepID=UPI0027DC4CAC|nr:spermatogenesis associated 6-like protein [Physella acuta]